MIRTAIDALLRDTGFEIIGSAATGEETIRRVAELEPDVLLLDVRMPAGSGLEVLRKVRSEERQLRVILLTATLDDLALWEATKLKVDGIVLKNSDPAYLIECLDEVKQGRSWFDPELGKRIAALGDRFTAASRPSLAPRERELIKCVRKGLRNREIAKQLGVTEGTVKVYLHAVFEKVGVSNRTELAIRADEFLGENYLSD
jgi:two-component system nitrate/nitrite response regulator NarP